MLIECQSGSCSPTPQNPDATSEATLESTECALVKKAAALATDLVLNQKETAPVLHLHGPLDHKACCYDQLKFLKAKLNTLKAMHQIGMCHGTVNQQYFFPPQHNETAYRWRHADSTAFYQDREFEEKCIEDLVQVGVEHIPDAHKEAVLEQTTVQADLEKLVHLLNNPNEKGSEEFTNDIDQIVTNTLRQLEHENRVFGDDQLRRSNLWIEHMHAKTMDDSTVFTHQSSPTHPQIKEWRIPKESADKLQQLGDQINVQFLARKRDDAQAEVLAWTSFEDNNDFVIRTAFRTSDKQI